MLICVFQIYMCITDDEFERSRAFIFLSEIKKKFLATYGLTAATALPYAMNTDFARVLSTEMKTCNESREYDSISRVHGQIDELKDIMVKNIENITSRGERLELLVNKSENLRDNVSVDWSFNWVRVTSTTLDFSHSQAVSFRQTSRTLARTLFWRNVRLYFLIGLLLLFIVYIITSMFCGGLTWSTCR